MSACPCVYYTDRTNGGPLKPARSVCPVKAVRWVKPAKSAREARPARSVHWSHMPKLVKIRNKYDVAHALIEEIKLDDDVNLCKTMAKQIIISYLKGTSSFLNIQSVNQ
jgi:hypothetical protein